MPKKQDNQSTPQGKFTTLDQISAGGVAFRWRDSEPEIAIVSVKPKLRWQLPKGIVDEGESPQVTAVREVREEAGVETVLIKLIETIEYWYRGVKYEKPVRYHKFVHFYLMEYKSGDVSDHDHEVEEARWVSIDEAMQMLDFKSERDVVEKAQKMIKKWREVDERGTSKRPSASNFKMNNSFSLLTLNCFGLWLPDTQRRLLALTKELEQSSYQVVCLQEIQLHKYQKLLVQGCGSYPYPLYEPYFHCPKGGLLTLSRIPITSKSFIPYVERGLWYTPMLLDKLFFKGMLITKLTWNDVPMVIINTHLLANFAGDWERHGMYAQVEEKQLQQLAETVRSQPEDSIIIVVGDFNVPRGGRLYYDFLVYSGLTDLLAGDTRPTLRIPLGVPSRFSLSIDYILVRIPHTYSFKIDCDLCFSEKYAISGRQQGYLSDHQGIELHLTTK